MGLDDKSVGALRTMDWIWGLEKPWVLKKAITELGFSGVVKRSRFEALRASCGDKPKLLMR